VKTPSFKQIRATNYNNLSIGADSDIDDDGIVQPLAVLLFTPSMMNTSQHWHIELIRNRLKNWRIG
jgi:hypothetical protein